MRYLILLLLFTSCGRDFNQDNWSDEVKEMFNNYLKEASYYDNKVAKDITESGDIVFLPDSEFDGSVVGTCMRWTNGDWKISINQDYWQEVDKHARELLMFHELGHCLHWFDHRTERKDDGYPMSIMYPYMFNGLYYNDNRSNYLYELHDV